MAKCWIILTNMIRIHCLRTMNVCACYNFSVDQQTDISIPCDFSFLTWNTPVYMKLGSMAATLNRSRSSMCHGCLIRMRSGEFGGQVSTLNSWSYSSGHSRLFFVVWRDALFCWGRMLPLGGAVDMYLGCIWSATVFRWVVCVRVSST